MQKHLLMVVALLAPTFALGNPVMACMSDYYDYQPPRPNEVERPEAADDEESNLLIYCDRS